MNKFLFIILCFIVFFTIRKIIDVILLHYVVCKLKKYVNNDPELSKMDYDEKKDIILKSFDDWTENYIHRNKLRPEIQIIDIILCAICKSIMGNIYWIKYLNEVS